MWEGRWLADGVFRNCGPALPCRQDYFAATGTRAGAFWSRCFAVFLCAHRPTLLFSERLRSPAAPCSPYGGAPCSTLSFCSVAVFESRKLVFGCRKWRVFGFWGYLGVFFPLNHSSTWLKTFLLISALHDADIWITKLFFHPYCSSARRFQPVCGIIRGSQYVHTASPFLPCIRV